MVSASAVSVGDSVVVSEGEEVVVEGSVRDVFSDGDGTRVKIRESEGVVVEFWEADDRSSVELGRRRVGSGRGGGRLKPIQVEDSARLVIVD